MRKATKQKRLDLWLDEADMARLTELADGWAISRQRVIESALTYATATAIDPSAAGDQYARSQRIPLNLDGLAQAQVARLAEHAEASDGIRAALRAFHAAQEPIDDEMVAAPIPYIRITQVQPMGGYQLHLRFDNGASGKIDIATLIEFKGVLAPLANPATFYRVTVSEHGDLCWPGDIDMDSNTLYYATMKLPNPLAEPEPA